MPVINVADKFTGEVLEQYTSDIGYNLLDWLKRHVPNFECREHPPISIAINGNITVQRCWDYVMREGDIVTIYPEPKDPGTIGTLILKAVVAYGVNYIANKLLAPKVDDNYNRTTPEGSSIYSANAQGNAARLNGIIPEVFGQHPTYPDYLFPPWREYVDNEEYLNIGLSVGAGYYGLPSGFGSIRIGNTPLTNYTDFIDIAVYNPDASIVNAANRVMYQAPEVGGTSNESGLELKREKEVTASMPAGTLYEFVGNQIKAWAESETTDNLGQFDEMGTYMGSIPVTQKTYSSVNWSSNGFADNAIIDVMGTGVYDGTYQIFEILGNEISVTKDGVPAWFAQTSKLQGSVSRVTSAEAGWFGWFSVTPPNVTANGFWVDLLFRGGIGKLENNGSISSLSVVHELQWRRKTGDTSINTVPFTTTGGSFDDHATSQPVVITGSAAEVEVRMRRVTATSNESNVRGNALWQRVRCLMPSPMTYPVTTLFLRIKGTDGLAANSENRVNLDVIRHLPVLYSGGSWATTRTGTRQISAAIGEVARGLGLISKIDTAKLAALEQIWTARGDWFDAVLDNDSTMFEVLRRVLAVGYAEPTIADGKISFVRDAATTTFDGQMWSWDNIIKLSEDGTLFDPDEPDGVRVEYFDRATRKPAYVDCLLPGDAGILPEEVRAFGITDKTNAWRYGMRLRRAKRYIRRRYTIETELEALNSHVGEVCTLPSRRGQHGYLVAHNPALWQITTNTALVWGSGTHYIRIRLPDGTGTFTAPVTRIDDYTVQFGINPLSGITLDFESATDPPLFVFGTLTEVYTVARLKSVNPSSGETVSVELTNYDARVYADDDNTAP